MIKIIKNQLIHRFLRTKSILLIYFLFVCVICMEISSKTRVLQLKTQTNLTLSSIFSMIKENITFNFYTAIIVLVVLFIVKLYKDYKQGATRWNLITKCKEGIIIGDILFIFITFVVLYVLCYIGVYICTQEVLVSVKETMKITTATSHQEIMNMMDGVTTIRMLFPSNVIGIIANLLAFLFIAQLSVYISTLLVKKDQRIIEIIGIVVSVALVFYSIVIFNSVLQIVIYLMFTGMYFYFTWKIKTTTEGAKKHVKD